MQSNTMPSTPPDTDVIGGNEPWTYTEYGVKWHDPAGGAPWYAGPHSKAECEKAIAAHMNGRYRGELAVRTVTVAAWGAAVAS